MKRLSLLSTINKLNKFGISPIYQYGLNSTTLRNSIITIQKRSYTSLSSSPPSTPPSVPTTTSTFSNDSKSKKNYEYSYQLESKLSRAISTREIEKKKLIIDGVLQSDKLLVNVKIVSTLLSQLNEYDISLALKLFDKYHNDMICHIENKKEMINNQKEKEKESDEEEIQSLYRAQSQPFEIILGHYIKKKDTDGLEKFCMKYISAYGGYVGSKRFVTVLEFFCQASFEKFTEFIFRLYSIESIAEGLSINTMIVSLLVQKYSNDGFNRFFDYHIERWGHITGKDASDIFVFLIPTKDLKTIVKVLNSIDSSKNDTTKLRSKVIINLFKLFSKTEKDITILVRCQDLLFKEMKKLEPKEIAETIFFYNVFAVIAYYKGEFKITRQFLSRLHSEFLTTLPKETTKIIINHLVKYFLSTNHYEKSLYWFNANSTIFANEISKSSIFNFIAYHTLQLDKINKKIENLTRQTTTTTTTTTTSEIIGEKEKEMLVTEIEEYLTNKKKNEEFLQFWRKTLKLSENETYDDKYLDMEKSVYSDFKNLDPSEILKSAFHTPEGYEGILSQVNYKRQLKFNKDYLHDITLSTMLKKDNFKGSEIFHYLNNNFLNKSQLPFGTLLLDTILKIQSLDKRENQKVNNNNDNDNNNDNNDNNNNNNNNNDIKKEEEEEEEKEADENKDEKKSDISGYWENNDSGFSKLTNKETNFIQPMLEGIKNDLILDRDLFDERYDQILSTAQQLLLLPELGENEIQILRLSLLNLYFYKTEESMVDYLKIVIDMIENDHTIPFDVFEQTCWLVLEQYSKLVNNGSVENITLLLKFIEKFTRENPTFEIGYLIVLKYLCSRGKYSLALSYIRLNPNFRNTRDTLLIETNCLLQLNEESTNWKEFFDRIKSFEKFENLAFLLNPIIKHLEKYPNELIDFENSVLTKHPYCSSLINIDNEALEALIYHHRKDPVQLKYYTRSCLQPYQTTDFLFFIDQANNLGSREFIKDKIKKCRPDVTRYSTEYLNETLNKK
ncbi:hypothetical protein ACTFIY_009942 [Dictyostelium cf. discoideum]